MNRRIIYFLPVLAILFFLPGLNAQPFWTEDFSNGLPADWDNADVSGNGVLWEFCDDYRDCPPKTQQTVFFFDDARFESSTMLNGYVFSKAQGHFSPDTFLTRLTAPAIDCSLHSTVYLRFESLLGTAGIPPNFGAVVRIKNANSDWIVFHPFPLLKVVDSDILDLRSWNPQVALLDISSVAANESEVEIQWQWEGILEWVWAMDDVALFDHNPMNERVVWGANPGEGDFAGGLNGWVTSNSLDTCSWVWSADGFIDNPIPSESDRFSCALSAANGMALLVSGACANAGEPTPFTFASLESPAIDLSGVGADTKLALCFSQAVQKGNPYTPFDPKIITSFAYSTDGGGTWSDPVDANPRLSFLGKFCGSSTFTLPPEVPGAADFKIKFTFAGDAVFWAIDDVRILERLDNDLEMKRNFFAIAPSFQTPSGQVAPFGFLADVQNIGNQAQTGVVEFASVQNFDTKEELFIDSLEFGTLSDCQLEENQFFDNLFTPDMEVASYLGRYTVRANESDGDPLNNEIHWFFEVSDSTFAKEREVAGSFNFFTPSSGPLRYEIGNCFFVPNGDGWYATGISFGIGLAALLPNVTLNVRLYKWEADSLGGEFIASPDEYEEIALNSFTIPPSSSNSLLVTIPISFDGSAVALENDSYYFATVAYDNPFQGIPFYIGASEEFDYTAMFLLSRQLDQPRYAPMFRQGDDPDFNTVGLGLDRIPIVRLHISNQVVATKETDLQTFEIQLSPNPVRDKLFLTTTQSGLPRKGAIRIFDTSGKLMASRPLQNGLINDLPVDVNNLPGGAYFLEIVTNGGVIAKKFVKIGTRK